MPCRSSRGCYAASYCAVLVYVVVLGALVRCGEATLPTVTKEWSVLSEYPYGDGGSDNQLVSSWGVGYCQTTGADIMTYVHVIALFVVTWVCLLRTARPRLHTRCSQR